MILHGMFSMTVSSLLDFACGRKIIEFILLQLKFEYLSYVHFEDLLFFLCIYRDMSLWFSHFLKVLISEYHYLFSDNSFGTVITNVHR